VEDWLCKVEAEMCATLRVLMVQCIAQHKKQKKDKWIKDWAGQLVLTVSQLSWTNECVKALSNTKEKDGSRAGLKVIKKKQVGLRRVFFSELGLFPFFSLSLQKLLEICQE
jgi:dynein heavy chain